MTLKIAKGGVGSPSPINSSTGNGRRGTSSRTELSGWKIGRNTKSWSGIRADHMPRPAVERQLVSRLASLNMAIAQSHKEQTTSFDMQARFLLLSNRPGVTSALAGLLGIFCRRECFG